MTGLLLGLLVPVLIVGGIIFMAVRRGLQMRELCDHGIETTGRIFSKRSVNGGHNHGRREKLAYEYTDNAGTIHRHTSVVPLAVYQAHEQGGTIPVVYSARKPSISAPKYLVDQCLQALGKK
jgi:hypothetical protein